MKTAIIVIAVCEVIRAVQITISILHSIYGHRATLKRIDNTYKDEVVNVLLKELEGCEKPCNEIDVNWCALHCKPGMGGPDIECWRKYVEREKNG